jgi:hypothetical protein
MGANLKGVAAIVVSALLAPILVGATLIVASPLLIDRFAYLNPSCDNPEGLSAIPLKQMYSKHRALFRMLLAVN